MEKVQDGIDQLLRMQTSEDKPNPPQMESAPARRPALKKTAEASRTARVKFASSSSAAPGLKPSSMFPSMDPAVVQAAIRAGVGEHSLKEMESLLASNPKGLKVKDATPKVVLDPLSEDEDEDGGSPETSSNMPLGEQYGDPLSAAMVKLTSLVDMLAEEKKKSAVTKLEAALDSVSGSTGDTSALGMGKKTAAARRALRQTFRDHPQEIHHLLEKLMSEDLLSTTVGPNMETPTLNARAWVEFRSRIGNFKTSAHAAWSAAGIVDALRSGEYHRARSIALLLLLQLDQTAIDKGSWTFSSELPLEPLPPFNALSQRQGPNVMDGEQPFSRLLDGRWADIAMAHLKDQDDYLHRRRNVGKNPKQSVDDKEEEEPRRRVKPKAKAKASSSQQDA